MKNLQISIGNWQKDTFKQATVHGLLNHLRREVDELEQVLNDYISITSKNINVATDLKNELADIVILTVALADLVAVDLEKAVVAKMVINKTRKWNKPDSQGVVEHVKEK